MQLYALFAICGMGICQFVSCFASVRVGMFLYCGDVEFDGGVVVVENEEERKAVR